MGCLVLRLEQSEHQSSFDSPGSIHAFLPPLAEFLAVVVQAGQSQAVATFLVVALLIRLFG
jgi:hypothetical protein